MAYIMISCQKGWRLGELSLNDMSTLGYVKESISSNPIVCIWFDKFAPQVGLWSHGISNPLLVAYLSVTKKTINLHG